MEEMGAAQTGSPAPSSSLKQRITYACEACRISKAKCEPSSTEGICRRYLGISIFDLLMQGMRMP